MGNLSILFKSPEWTNILYILKRWLLQGHKAHGPDGIPTACLLKEAAHNNYSIILNQSYESQLIITINELASRLNLGEQIDVITLDFSKALIKCHMHAYFANWTFIK